jgi:hypothetical protein
MLMSLWAIYPQRALNTSRMLSHANTLVFWLGLYNLDFAISKHIKVVHWNIRAIVSPRLLAKAYSSLLLSFSIIVDGVHYYATQCALTKVLQRDHCV